MKLYITLDKIEFSLIKIKTWVNETITFCGRKLNQHGEIHPCYIEMELFR